MSVDQGKPDASCVLNQVSHAFIVAFFHIVFLNIIIQWHSRYAVFFLMFLPFPFSAFLCSFKGKKLRAWTSSYAYLLTIGYWESCMGVPAGTLKLNEREKAQRFLSCFLERLGRVQQEISWNLLAWNHNHVPARDLFRQNPEEPVNPVLRNCRAVTRGRFLRTQLAKVACQALVSMICVHPTIISNPTLRLWHALLSVL